jgi:hypothetical protein
MKKNQEIYFDDLDHDPNYFYISYNTQISKILNSNKKRIINLDDFNPKNKKSSKKA